jgi:transposase
MIISNQAKKFKSDTIIGVDISQDKFDIAISSESGAVQTFANDAKGHQKFIKVIKAHKPKLILMEATGKCETRLALALQKAKLPFRIENPAKIRSFSKSMGMLEKTDKIDARMIALAGEKLDLSAKSSKLNHLTIKLKEHVRTRFTLIEEVVRLENVMSRMLDADLKMELLKLLARISESKETVEIKIKKMIDSNEEFSSRFKLLTSVPGIGFVTAATMIADCEELGETGRGQLAKLAGLAPLANDSGKTFGKRHIRGGRKNLRNALYMAMLATVKYNPKIKAFYERLKSNGKPAKVAMVACARKMLGLLNAMIKHKKEWHEFAGC